VILLNRSGADHEISVTWEELGYPNSISASVRDLWQHKDLGKMAGRFSASVASHGVVMVRVSP
jgi:alpha-galactosidase